ncbi:MAG: hypothetical protein C0483_07965 [Pirellula sp.]|nr:hypothetical protein [Pirellula sp.]
MKTICKTLRRMAPQVSWLLIASLFAGPGVGPLLAADPSHNRPFRLLPFFQEDVGRKPKTGEDTCMEELARNIDWLEHQIDVFGTVVPKTPDVWGEARLTAHRQEFEQELVRELTKFDFNRINGAQLVQDQSFLAFALSMKNAQLGGDNGVPAPEITINNTPTSTTGTTISTGASNTGGSITQNPLGNATNPFGLSTSNVTFGTTTGIELEQTEVLDQLARYINHLHEHRRINEGDDTSDAPGYAMNLVRIPVSVLPGSATKHGYGAEITVTAEPYLGPELLPMAFRDLVINDLVDQLSLPLTRFLNNDPKQVQELKDLFVEAERFDVRLAEINARRRNQERVFSDPIAQAEVAKKFEALAKERHTALRFFQSDGAPTEELVTEGNIEDYSREYWVLVESAMGVGARVDSADKFHSQLSSAQSMPDAPRTVATPSEGQDDPYRMSYSRLKMKGNELKADEKYQVRAFAETDAAVKPPYIPEMSIHPDMIRAKAAALTTNISMAASTTRKATLPFPPSHLIDNYGLHELAHIALEASESFQADVLNREVVHVTDVQSLLREELGAAYELLRTEEMRPWWDYAADGRKELYNAIRQRNQPAVTRARDEFLNGVGMLVRHHGSTGALAWCIYVESLLLNERLILDMKETFGNQPNRPVIADWLPYFGPDPCQEARDAFAQYVRVRWPIHVFHIDPVNTEQNIADVSSVYRQMQMAVALAFSQRRIGVSAALQTMRRLQRDRATFDLNRTVVGFGHGDDTFGWKFYPRFQTPPVESNVTVFFRDLVIGGPTDKHLECAKEIEPGQRECTAVVLMPSFVPHVTFHTRSNWFRLNCAAHTSSSVHDTIHYSRVVKQMENCATQCVQCSHLYRDGEVDRLMKRVHQIDRKLALQTLECQVPIENTHGGFEIFSAGTRELAPELVGWYGAPGYDRSRPTRMFFSGDNFSVATCRLIAGNQEIPFKLLSRQIMEVALPAGLPVIRDKKLQEAEIENYDGYIDAHVATPYGVSGHLLIPAVRSGQIYGNGQMVPQVIRLKAQFEDNDNDRIFNVTLQSPTALHPLIFNIPSSLRTGGTTEKFDLALTTGAARLADTTISVTTVAGTDVAVFDAAATLDLFTDAAATKLKTKIQQSIKAQLDAGVGPNGSISFTLTSTLKREGAAPVFIPFEGSITIEVALAPQTASNGQIGVTQMEGFVQDGSSSMPSGSYSTVPAPTTMGPRFNPPAGGGFAPITGPSDYAGQNWTVATPPGASQFAPNPVRETGPVPMMSSAPTARGSNNPQPPIFVAPRHGLRNNLLGDD